MHDVVQDLRRMGVRDWKLLAQQRNDCRKVVKEVKPIKGCRAMEEGRHICYKMFQCS